MIEDPYGDEGFEWLYEEAARRIENDTGERVSLDDLIEELGFDPSDLEE